MDKRTDRQTELLYQYRASVFWRAIKTFIHFTRLLKINHSPPIYHYILEMVEDRWVYAARHFTCIESFFQPCNIYRDCPRGITRRGQNVQEKVLKWRTVELTCWITGKWLKIDGYMLWCVWQALNPLFIHVTFTAIVRGAYRPTQLTHVPLVITILLVCLGITPKGGEACTSHALHTTGIPSGALNHRLL